MSSLRYRARTDWRVLLPVSTGAIFTIIASAFGDGPGGAPTGWYAAYFGLTTALTAPSTIGRRWYQRLALAIGGLLQIYAGLWLLLAGVGVLLMVTGVLALWAAARPRHRGWR